MAYDPEKPFDDLPLLLPVIGFVVDAKLGERKTASIYLRELERLGIPVGEKIGREVIYRHPALLDVLKG